MKVLREDIASKNFKRVYLLFGEEDYLIKAYRDALKTAALGGAGDTENYTYFDGNSYNLNELEELAVTFPFFAEKRVIVLDNGSLFGSENSFADFLDELPDTTVLILTEKNIDKRAKLYKKIKDIGYACEFTQLKPEDVESFAAARLAKSGLKITQNNCSFLVEGVGGDLYNIASEVDKLAAYCLGRTVVEREDIEAVCCMQIENKIFDLVDCLILHNRKEALDIYFNLIALRESPLKLLRFMMSRYNRMLMIMYGIRDGKPDAEIASLSKQPEWTIKKYRAKLRGSSPAKLVTALEACAVTEEDIKTGRVTEEIGMELLLEKLSGQ